MRATAAGVVGTLGVARALEALAELGSRPLLQPHGTRERVERAPAGPRLPPKEALAVMPWVLQQWRGTAPGTLER